MALLMFREEEMLDPIAENDTHLKYFLVSGKPLLRLSLANSRRQ
jgi:hypothetical protein